MSKHPIDWVVIVDGSRARIVVPTERRATYVTLRRIDSADAHLRSRDLGSDRPGRVYESAATSRHMIEPRSDAHDRAQDEFVRTVAAALNAASAKSEFDRLVVVAQPRIAAQLRDGLDESVRRKILGEIAKDLVKTPDSELAPHFPIGTRTS